MLLIGTTPIGGPILGAVSDFWGARAPVVIGGVAALLAAAWGYALARHRVHDGAERGAVTTNADLTGATIASEPT